MYLSISSLHSCIQMNYKINAIAIAKTNQVDTWLISGQMHCYRKLTSPSGNSFVLWRRLKLYLAKPRRLYDSTNTEITTFSVYLVSYSLHWHRCVSEQLKPIFIWFSIFSHLDNVYFHLLSLFPFHHHPVFTFYYKIHTLSIHYFFPKTYQLRYIRLNLRLEKNADQ